jgi:hypothetical protein
MESNPEDSLGIIHFTGLNMENMSLNESFISRALEERDSIEEETETE